VILGGEFFRRVLKFGPVPGVIRVGQPRLIKVFLVVPQGDGIPVLGDAVVSALVGKSPTRSAGKFFMSATELLAMQSVRSMSMPFDS
jgi:hypothetical protein